MEGEPSHVQGLIQRPASCAIKPAYSENNIPGLWQRGKHYAKHYASPSHSHKVWIGGQIVQGSQGDQRSQCIRPQFCQEVGHKLKACASQNRQLIKAVGYVFLIKLRRRVRKFSSSAVESAF